MKSCDDCPIVNELRAFIRNDLLMKGNEMEWIMYVRLAILVLSYLKKENPKADEHDKVAVSLNAAGLDGLTKEDTSALHGLLRGLIKTLQ